MTAATAAGSGEEPLQALPAEGAARAGLVLLHGVGSDATVWTPQLRGLGDLRPVAFDMPGYRGSVADASREAAAVARRVLASLPSHPVHLVGLSLGAVVAAHVAALAPRRVASLVLSSGFLVYPDGAGVARRASEAAARDGMAALAAGRVSRIVHPASEDAIRRDVVATMSAIPVAAYQRMAEAVWSADLRAVAPRIRAPTLVLVGDADTVTPLPLARELATAIPGSRLAVLEGASHLANLDQPGAFNDAVRRHVTSVAEVPA